MIVSSLDCLMYRHGKEGVSTMFCNIYEKAEYTIYATVVDGECTHIPTKQVFTTECMYYLHFLQLLWYIHLLVAFSPDMKWSIGSNTVWASNCRRVH